MKKFITAIQDTFEKNPVLFSVLLISLTVLLFYSNSFTADWHYDDFHHIKENINIRKLSNIPSFFTDPSTFSRNPNTRMYRPLLMTTHAFNYWFAILTTRDGYNVVGYHVVNFIFHLISSLAIFFTTLFLFKSRISIKGLNPFLPAIFASLLFGLHTINTETIVYISSRSSVMATMFYLLAFWMYLRATREESVKTYWAPLLTGALLYFLGFLSKEIAATLPGIIFFYEITLNRQWMTGQTLAQKIKLLFLRLLPYGVVFLLMISIRRSVYGENLVERFFHKGGTQAARDWVSQLATQTRAWVYYLREWLWPTGLSIDKPFRVSQGFGEAVVLICLLLLFAILIFALTRLKKHPAITFGILWWFTALLPSSLFRLNVVINDHRLYMPGYGLALVFTYTVALLYPRFKADGGVYFRAFVALCLAILLFMGLGTLKRNAAFATEETIWKDVILKDPRSVRGYNNLGIWYEQHGEYDKALAHYQQTIKLAPMFPNPYINIGNVYHKQKKYEPAEKWMKRAIQLDPKSALANYNLGNILREAGKTQEAIQAYSRALELNPRYIEAANNLANVHFKMKNFAEAIRYYQYALAIDPTFAMSYYNIALANENLGRFDEAIENLERFKRFWIGDKKYLNLAEKKIQDLQSRKEN